MVHTQHITGQRVGDDKTGIVNMGVGFMCAGTDLVRGRGEGRRVWVRYILGDWV